MRIPMLDGHDDGERTYFLIHLNRLNLLNDQFPVAIVAIYCDPARALAVTANNLCMMAAPRFHYRPNPNAPIFPIWWTKPAILIADFHAIPTIPIALNWKSNRENKSLSVRESKKQMYRKPPPPPSPSPHHFNKNSIYHTFGTRKLTA